MEYPIRYLARFIVEAVTPLAVSSGGKDIITDSPVVVDINEMPKIPGTSLCGVLRHSLLEIGITEEQVNVIFGYQDKDDGRGSRIIVSDAIFVGKGGKIIEGISDIDNDDPFYRHFLSLPIRQHCAINAYGTAKKRAKFDGQVVYKGTRFIFELELTGNDEDTALWKKIIETIGSPLFRIGGGTRKGFGALKIVSLEQVDFNLKEPGDLDAYLARSSSLATGMASEKSNLPGSSSILIGYTTYRLCLKPDDFFLFGSGFGDDEVDIQPVFEKSVTWSNGIPEFTTAMTLVPATSLKGAVAHRTAYHYNRSHHVFADTMTEKDIAGRGNAAVEMLFGCAQNNADNAEDSNSGQRGKVIFSDLLIETEGNKILNHVSIDRFTGGTLDGVLFHERVLFGNGGFTLEIIVENNALSDDDETVQHAFEQTLTDLTEGMLPLGGGVMRGHGVFTGKVEKNRGDGQWIPLTLH